MIRPLKIAHTSDVHLSNDADGQNACQAFTRVIDLVRDSDADIFLIAGDLFDHNRVTPALLDFACGELARMDRPVVMIAGNHDCWAENAALRRMRIDDAGSHVTLLTDIEGTRQVFPALHATVWGRCMVDHAADNRPLAGAPPRHENFWHIGMAHGLYMEKPDLGRSSPILADEIAQSGFDYLALGHVHFHRQYRHGQTLACYPGAPVTAYPNAPVREAVNPTDGCVTFVEMAPGMAPRAVVRALPAS